MFKYADICNRFIVRSFEPLEAQMDHPKYRSDIDGLRGIAVLAVVLFHFVPKHFKSGFIGVDIFFVISGFLISTIIIKSIEDNSFSFGEFYARRIRRIFPSLIFVMIATFLLGWYVLLPSEFAQLGKHLLGGATFTSNLVLWNEASYFDPAESTKPLHHLWSLAVEEQFYLVWPVLLFWASKRKTNYLFLILAVALLSFSLNLYLASTNTTAAFYCPFSRFFELMIGSAIAALTLEQREIGFWVRNLSSWIGFLFLTLGFICIDSSKQFPGSWALLPCCGSALVISGGSATWFNRNLLGNRIFIGLGLISYPLYLWHWIFYSYNSILGSSHGAFNRSIIYSVVLSVITYFLVEKRFRVVGKKAVVALLGGMLLVALAGCFTMTGIVIPHVGKGKQILIFDRASSDWTYPNGFETKIINGATFYVKRGKTCKTTLFVGDSHMEQYGPRILRLLDEGKANKTAMFAATGGCIPVPGFGYKAIVNQRRAMCEKIKSEAIRIALDDRNVDTVVFSAYWSEYFKNNLVRYLSGAELSQAVAFRDVLPQLEKNIRSIASKNKRVILVTDNPTGANFEPKVLISQIRFDRTLRDRVNRTIVYDGLKMELFERLSSITKRTGTLLLDPAEYLCRADECFVLDENDVPIYKDQDHLRSSFAREHASFIDFTVIQ